MKEFCSFGTLKLYLKIICTLKLFFICDYDTYSACYLTFKGAKMMYIMLGTQLEECKLWCGSIQDEVKYVNSDS